MSAGQQVGQQVRRQRVELLGGRPARALLQENADGIDEDGEPIVRGRRGSVSSPPKMLGSGQVLEELEVSPSGRKSHVSHLVPEGWWEAWSDQGTPYYYNGLGEVRWELPDVAEELTASQDALQSIFDSGSDDGDGRDEASDDDDDAPVWKGVARPGSSPPQPVDLVQLAHSHREVARAQRKSTRERTDRFQ